MIILRRFIIANIVANVAPLIASPYTTTPLQLKQATNTGIANALYFYLNLQKILLIPPVFPSVGVIATAPPVPGAALASMNVIVPPPALLISLLNTVTGPGVPNPTASTQFYQHIATWLSTPPITATISTITSIPPTIFGSSIVNFPLMPLMGTVSFYAMIAAGAAGLFTDLFSSNPLEAPFEILSNFIFAGLVANFIAPVPTIGTIGSAYSGMTFPFWLMIDCPDFPIGSGGLCPILSLFGLSDLTDDTIIAKQQEILDGLTDPTSPFYEEPVTTSSCELTYTPSTSSYSKNPSCTNQIINSILDNGCSGDTNYQKPINQYLDDNPIISATGDSDTVWKIMPDTIRTALETNPSTSSLFEDFPGQTLDTCTGLLDSAQIDQININYSNIQSNALNIPSQNYDDYELEFANINMNIIEPTITAIFERPLTPFTGFDPTAIVITNPDNK